MILLGLELTAHQLRLENELDEAEGLRSAKEMQKKEVYF